MRVCHSRITSLSSSFSNMMFYKKSLYVEFIDSTILLRGRLFCYYSIDAMLNWKTWIKSFSPHLTHKLLQFFLMDDQTSKRIKSCWLLCFSSTFNNCSHFRPVCRSLCSVKWELLWAISIFWPKQWLHHRNLKVWTITLQWRFC